ncbi:MAG: rhodanese-like domain-containing protein, partial [Terriglobales bacterium]
ICLGSRAKAEYAFRPFSDGEELALGDERGVKLRVLHTPGHTPESITILIFEGGEAQPRAALTGDTLFIGDVGRPDLRAALGWPARQLGEMLYDSLQQKLLRLPDATLIYPAHGAGSLCGKNLSRDTVGTLGDQRRFNYALQPMARERFLELVLAGQAEAPAYFTYDAVLNTRERSSLEASLKSHLRPLDLEAAATQRRAGARLLDVRPAGEFARAHWKGALNIGLEGTFATWCGTLLDPAQPLILVAEPGREREAAVRLGRIGFDRIAGYLQGGMAALAPHPEWLASHARLLASDWRERRWLDVRTEAEAEAGAVPGSFNIPLAQLCARRAEVRLEAPLGVYCQGGYRSAIAASLIEDWGLEVAEMAGGFSAWAKANTTAAQSSH